MLNHCLGDPAIQFEMATVLSLGAKLMRVIRYCIDRPLSWRFTLDRPQQKLAVLVDADHASHETTRKRLQDSW